MPSLTDFLKEHALTLRTTEPDVQKLLNQWIQAEQNLIRQLEEWLKAADPEGVLKIQKENYLIREEKLGSYDAVWRMKVDLGGRRMVNIVPRGGAVGGVVPLEDGRPSPIRGLVEISNDIDRYRLYRVLDGTADRWYIKHHLADRAVPLERSSFEAAMVDLLK
jgi:hypothetical protein